MKSTQRAYIAILGMVMLSGFIFAQDTTVTVTNEGNVGIGTTTPQFKLDIKGDIGIGSGTTAATLHLDEIQDAKWSISTFAYRLGFYNDLNIDRMVIHQNGNVGLGIFDPTEKLDLFGGSFRITNGGESNAILERPFIYLNHTGPPNYAGGISWQTDGVPQLELFYSEPDSGLLLWDPYTGPHFFLRKDGAIWTNGMVESTTGFRFPDGTTQTTAATISNGGISPWNDALNDNGIYTTGNVGIGTDSPEFKLDTKGDARIGSGAERAILYFDEIENAKWNISTEGYRLSFNNDSSVSKMTILQSGRVGIGTVNPNAALSVSGTTFIHGNKSNEWGEFFPPSIDLAIDDNDTGFEVPQDGTLAIYTDNSERMRINNVGVGIGTDAPTEMLQIADFSTFSNNYLKIATAGVNVSNPPEDRFAGIKLRHFNDNWGVTLESVDGQDKAGLYIKTHVNDPAGQTAMFIRSDGAIGIGTDIPDNPLEMASGAHVTAGGVWTNASSRALKDNISGINADEALSALSALNPVKYNYISEPGEEYLGFIAEDVPSLVATNDRKSLSPMDIVALLTKVVQEQQKKIAELEQRINSGR